MEGEGQELRVGHGKAPGAELVQHAAGGGGWPRRGFSPDRPLGSRTADLRLRPTAYLRKYLRVYHPGMDGKSGVRTQSAAGESPGVERRSTGCRAGVRT